MKFISVILFVLCSVYHSDAADLYWINGSGNWNNPGHWSLTSGGLSCNCIPDSSSNVYFDGNSFIPGDSISIDASAFSKDLTFIATAPVSIAGINPLNIYGSLIMNAGLTISYTGSINFLSQNSGNVIVTAGNMLQSPMVFSGTGGEWNLNDSLFTSQSITLTSGNLRTNNNTVSAKRLISQGNQPRNLFLGSSQITLDNINTNNTLHFSGNNFNLDAGNSLISFTGARTGLICLPGTVFHDVVFNSIDRNNPHFIQGGNSIDTIFFNSLSLSNSTDVMINISVNELFLNGGSHFQFNKVLLGNLSHSASCYEPIEIINSTFIKSTGIVSLNYARLSNVNGIGGATFIADNSIEIAPCNGWNINEPVSQTYYWTGGKGQWNDATHWSLSSGGQSSGCVPGCTDDVVFDSNSFILAGDSLLMNRIGAGRIANCCRSMKWQPVLHNPVLEQGLTIFGSLELHPSMQTAIHPMTPNVVSFWFSSDSTDNIIVSAGKQLGGLAFNGSGEWLINDSLDADNIWLYHGHLNTNSQYLRLNKLECWSNDSTDTLTLGASVIAITADFNSPYSGYFDISDPDLNVNAGTSLIRLTGASNEITNHSHKLHHVEFLNAFTMAKLWNQGNKTSEISNVTFSGNGRLTGNHEINSLTFTQGKIYSLNANDTTYLTGNFNAIGTSTDTIRIFANNTSFIEHNADMICLDYIKLQNIHAIGSSIFYAGTNSIDLGNNNGWLFQSCSTVTVNETSSSSCFYLLPNFTQDHFKLFVKSRKPSQMLMFDVTGKLIKEQTIIQDINLIDISGLKKGLYYISLTENGRSIFLDKVLKY